MAKKRSRKDDEQAAAAAVPPESAASPAADEAAETADAGVSLDSLSAAFAEMLGRGDDPYEEVPEPAATTDDEAVAELVEELTPQDSIDAQDAACEISPTTIVEAMLFVGDPEQSAVSAKWLAGLMRGVREEEIDGVVRALNERYEAQNSPYVIVSEADGYRMGLRPEFGTVRDKVYGRNRAARLSQAAVEVLSVVAYRGGLTAEQVSALRGSPSGGLLKQLVRRQLLRIERPEGTSRKDAKFVPTRRFLELFGLESLDDLPRGQDVRPA
ncbi:MAG: SMC-Scp complex subunit ScpB [Planctomycetaceae bacterium]|nr:SMC-Scp complex subunit ScpB [Planctomycetaceae bacterium]